MRLSLIIPCYNEAKNLPLLLERCRGITLLHSDVEVILVDNGSTDESSTVLSELLPQFPGCRSVRVEKNEGYGFGILSGLRQAQGELLAWTHADMQTDPQDALRGLLEFDSLGNDTFVKGRRYGRPLGDVIFTVGMSVFETILMRRPMWDINAQPTMFSKSFFDTWSDPPKDFSLDLFAYYQAKVAGLKVKRFPVRFSERAHGSSHWNVDFAAKRKFIKRTVDFSLELRKRVAK